MVKRNGEIIAANRAAESLFKSPEKKISGRQLSDCLSEYEIEDEASFRSKQEVIDSFISSESVFSPDHFYTNVTSNIFVEYDAIAIGAKGERIPVVLFANAVDETGETVLTVMPMKELKLVQKLDSIQAQLDTTARLASIGGLAAGIAHEINNPLSIIHGYIDNLSLLSEMEDVKNEDVVRVVEAVENMIVRISRIIKGLQAMSRDESGDPFVQTRMDEIVEMTIGLCKKKFFDHGVEFVFEKPKQNIELECHPTQICQVLVNLLSNAIDAVCEMPDPWVRLEISQFDQTVHIRVVDSGPGIPPELQLKIMEPFFTTKGVGKGTGYGLSLSHSIVGRHKGVFELDTRSENTCFQMWLPVIQSEEELQVGEKEEHVVERKEQKTVLIVDDEGQLCELVESFLVKEGISADSANSGSQALAKIKENNYQLVLSDIRMPDGDGFFLLKEVRALDEPPAVVIMTGSTDVKRDEFVKQGAVGFLYKPVRRAELIEVVKKALQDKKELPVKTRLKRAG